MSLPAPLTFGALLRQLRRRAQMTQGDLAAGVGYSVSFISSLEQNTRRPDAHSVLQHFVPALALQDEPHLATHLLELAAAAQGDLSPSALTLTRERRIVIAETTNEPPTNLPTPPTPLIGRDQTVQMLSDRLLGHQGRLLTLVGPPGVGKTRLALAVAANLQAFHPDGVYFVSLAPVSDPNWVAAALVNALAIAANPDKPPEQRLIKFLRRKELLLLLDNFEQVSAAAPLVATLLAECPGVRLLVTSRERLHLRAEQRYPVQPLAMAAACELFVKRAQAIDPAFVLTPENQPVIVAICQRLDCLPLALELSAVQLDLFSPPALLARLQDQRLDLLANGPRDLPAHHQTLRYAIERSYTLLPEREQALLRTLGLFVGGFDRKAVMALGFAEATLQALVNKSLVQVEKRGLGEPRFLLLETVREYARERLATANELARVCDQHASYFLTLAEAALPHFGGNAEKEWLDRLTCEHDNLRAALSWLIQFKATLGQQMASRLAGFWSGASHFGEGRDWLAKALAADTQPTPTRASALQAAGKLAQDQNDNLPALHLAQESLTLFEAQGDWAGCASALYVIGWALAEMEQPAQALSHFERSLSLARQAGQMGLVAFACINIANMLIRLGGPESRIAALLQEGKALFRQRNRPAGLAYGLRTEARLKLAAGDYIRSAALIQEALALLRPLGVQWEIATTLEELADTVWRMRDDVTACLYLTEALQFFQENDIALGLNEVWYDFGQIERCVRHNLALAADYYKKSLILCWEKQYKKLFGRALVGLACVAQARSDYVQAAQLAGLAQRLFDGLPPFFAPMDRDEYAKLIDDTRIQLGETAFAAAWTAGQAMSVEAAVAIALAGNSAL